MHFCNKLFKTLLAYWPGASEPQSQRGATSSSSTETNNRLNFSRAAEIFVFCKAIKFSPAVLAFSNIWSIPFYWKLQTNQITDAAPSVSAQQVAHCQEAAPPPGMTLLTRRPPENKQKSWLKSIVTEANRIGLFILKNSQAWFKVLLQWNGRESEGLVICLLSELLHKYQSIWVLYLKGQLSGICRQE